MTNWNDLELELDAWAAEDRSATLWWRDDDATTTTPELESLLELSETYDIPITLAAIPAELVADLPDRIENLAQVSIVQHGWSHANHAPPSQKKAELGAHRPKQVVLEDLERGKTLLRQKCSEMQPILVPPWNRIAVDVVNALAEIGFLGLSTFGPRTSQPGLDSITIANTHADIIDWRGSRGFAGTSATLSQIIKHLQERRLNAVDATEATGLLTHHLVHTQECWQFLSQLFRFTAGHPAARWLTAQETFACPGDQRLQV